MMLNKGVNMMELEYYIAVLIEKGLYEEVEMILTASKSEVAEYLKEQELKATQE